MVLIRNNLKYEWRYENVKNKTVWMQMWMWIWMNSVVNITFENDTRIPECSLKSELINSNVKRNSEKRKQKLKITLTRHQTKYIHNTQPSTMISCSKFWVPILSYSWALSNAMFYFVSSLCKCSYLSLRARKRKQKRKTII